MLETLVTDLTDPRLWIFILIVSAVGLAEKLAIYSAGKRASEADLTGLPGVTEERQARLILTFQTKGTYILLLASIPGIGAAMTAVAGYVGVVTTTFILWVTISILVRNWLIVILTGQLIGLF
jgi:membrane protein YqaA with SNARE-associated domain